MRKRVFKYFSYAECDDFSAYLNEMAMQGWHFTGWERGLVFEKGELKRTEYAVEVIVQKNKDEKKAKQEKVEFADYCEMAGWKLITIRGNFYIFEKIGENGTPIMTAEERVKKISSVIFAERAIRFFIPFIVFLDFLLGFLMRDVKTWLFQDGVFEASMIPFVAVLFAVWSLCSVTFWKKKKMKQVESGEEVYFGKGENKILVPDKIHFIFDRIWQIILIIVLIGMGQKKVAGGFLILFVIELFLYVKEIFFKNDTVNYGWHRGFSFMMTILIIYGMTKNMESPVMNETKILEEQDLVFSQKDFREVGYGFDGATYRELKAKTGTIKSYNVVYDDTQERMGDSDSFYCEIYESEYDWILNRIWNESDDYINEDNRNDTEKWGAEKAISGTFSFYVAGIFSDEESILTKDTTVTESEKNRLYLIQYEEKIVFISEKTDLTQEQIGIIREKLDLR